MDSLLLRSLLLDMYTWGFRVMDRFNCFELYAVEFFATDLAFVTKVTVDKTMNVELCRALWVV
jgi:hypothetical protein